MQAERWTQVEELFHAALAQPPERRGQFLAEACRDDRELREEVQSLLDSGDDGFLEDTPAGVPPQESFQRGYKLSHFEILEPIGRGGMGHVYRARDLRLEREVAIKVLPLDFARDPRRVVRFEREARACSALNHPNIVQIYETGQQASVYWIVTELVHGSTPRDAMKSGPFTVRRAVAIAAQVADALAAAHASGIIHRDLNPANIMLTGDNRAKILDFGLAKQTDTASLTAWDSSATITIPGLIFGTPGYLAPEQITGYGSDQRSDIFALGVILQEMLSGKRVFEGSSTVEVLNATVKNEPPELPSSVPSALARIIQRCLEKDPERRFQSAADLSFALQTLAEPSPPLATVPKHHSMKWLGLISAAALLLAAGAYWLGGRTKQPTLRSHTILRRLTIDSGLSTDGTISPDGKLAAYASDRADSNNLDIWVKQIDAPSVPVRLTTDPADEYDPTFSPDGTEIVYRSERDGGGVYVIPTLGGEARLFIPHARRPRFSPDGKFVLYWTGVGARSNPNGESAIKLFIQPVEGGTPVRVGANCAYVYASAVWSPDSRRILFEGSCKNHLSIWLFNLTEGRLEPSDQLFEYMLDNHFRVSYEFHDARFLFHAWASSPSRLLASRRTGDESSVAAIPISSDGFRIAGPFQNLTSGTGFEDHASIASTGRVVISGTRMSFRVWGLPINTQADSSGAPRPLAPENCTGASLSRDGRILFVRSNTRQTWEIRSIDLQTSKQTLISAGPGTAGGIVNQAGTSVIYAIAQKNKLALWQVASVGGLPHKLLDADFDPTDWSADSRFVLGVTGATATVIRILDLQTGRLTNFLQDRGRDVWQAHFSPDGRWVTFNSVGSGHSQLYIAPFRKALVAKSEWSPITDGSGWDDKPHFSHRGDVLFFTSDRDGYRCIWAQRLGPGMHLAGAPYAVFHSHSSGRSIGNVSLSLLELAVAPKLIAFDQMAFAGDVWLLEPEKQVVF